MKSFLFKTVVLCALWGAFFFHEGTVQSVPILSICIAVTALFFFLIVSPKPVYLYSIIFVLLFILDGYITAAENPFSTILLFYFFILAMNHLNTREFKWLIIGAGIGLSFLYFRKPGTMINFLFFLYVLLRTNESAAEKKEQRRLYEELLSMYRQLKRTAYETEDAARNEERTRIARDIHDSVGHKLTALLMQLEILSIEHGSEYYIELKKLAQESLEETRFAVRTLKSSEQEGISTILQLIKRLESESHIIVHFAAKQGILQAKLTNEQSVTLYRVIQEGLTNAMRHAHSKNVHVELGRSAIGDVEFLIKNRIHNVKPFQEGFGLQNMRKRVEEIGGSIFIYQANEEFVVKGTIPHPRD